MKRFVFAFLTFLAAYPVSAHSFYSNYCCSGEDCQLIPIETVEMTPLGYRITLYPKEHITLFNASRNGNLDPNVPIVYFVEYKKALVSPDGKYHGCIVKSSIREMRCLYAPGHGS